MNKDKNIIKSPYYSLEELTGDSSFIKRGLRDLSVWPKIEELYQGLLKNYLDYFADLINEDSKPDPNLIKESIKLCLEIFGTEPEHVGTIIIYAFFLYKQKDYDKAIIYFTKGINNDERLRSFLSVYRAKCYFKVANFQEAFNDYKSSLSFIEKKNQLWTLYMMSLCLFNLNDYTNAYFWLDQAIAISEANNIHNESYMIIKAQFLEKGNKISEALEQYKKTLKKFPTSEESNKKVLELSKKYV